MSVEALGALLGGATSPAAGQRLVGPAGAGTPVGRPQPSTPAGTTTGPTQASFAEGLAAVEGLAGAEKAAATGLATGSLTDVHAYTVAAAKSSLAVEMTTAVRNRAVDAFQEIMRMQV